MSAATHPVELRPIEASSNSLDQSPIKNLLKYIHELALNAKFYGKVELTYRGGNVEVVRTEQTRKLSDFDRSPPRDA